LKDVEEGLDNGYLAFLGLKPETYLTPGFLYLVSEEHLTPGDALHIYTAALLNPEVFVTADAGQLRAAESRDMRIFNPEKDVWR
jgi:predicted nucleic acid-binding protein